jgi:hypothetical protein
MPIEAAPLLHVMERASVVTALDREIIVLGALLVVAALAWIWGPLPLRGARARRLATRVAVWTLVPAAVLPSVLPYDHIFGGSPETSAESHARHCHGAPASCSDAPVASGPGQFLTSEPLAVAPASFVVLLLAVAPVLIGLTWRPALRPPLIALVQPA